MNIYSVDLIDFGRKNNYDLDYLSGQKNSLLL